MKNKIITVGVVALIASLAMASTVFAAEGKWSLNAEGNWNYIKNEEIVCDEFVGNYFVDEDGNWLVDAIFEHGDNWFAVDENGLKVTNAWKFTNALDEEESARWIRLDAKGKTCVDGWYTIDGLKYHFTNRFMDYGFLDVSGDMLDQDVEYVWKNATYYCGTENEGWRHDNYWIKVDADNDDGYAWLYFDAKGVKVVDCKKNINGVTYHFDEDGAMTVGFYEAAPASPSAGIYYPIDNYFTSAGELVKTGWIYATADGEEEPHWYYGKSDGELVKDQIKKINGYYYAFDGDGKMITGFAMVNFDIKQVCQGHSGLSVDEIEDVAAWQTSMLSCGDDDYMYFNEAVNGSIPEGAAVLGKTTLKLACGEYTFNFSANHGDVTLASGAEVAKKVVKNYLYVGGVLAANEDPEHPYMPIEIDSKWYILNCKTGHVSVKGTFTDSEGEIKFQIKDNVVKFAVKNADGKWGAFQNWAPPV